MTRPYLLTVGLLLAASPLFSAEERVRNPFWPQGYVGVRYPISETPRHPTEPDPPPEQAVDLKLKPGETVKTVTNSVGRVMQIVESELDDTKEVKEEAPRKTPQQIEDELWKEASRRLHFSNPLSFVLNGKTRQSITINGLVYGNGDLVSVNDATNRFTWIIQGLSTNKSLRVERVKRRPLSAEER